MAAPDDFIPELPGWHGRSPFIDRHGRVDYHHYDYYGPALAKIDRGHTQDAADVGAMGRRGLIRASRLLEYFDAIEPALIRYPALEPAGSRDRALRAADEIGP